MLKEDQSCANHNDALTGSDQRKRLVILGSGWAALSVLRHLDTKNYGTSPFLFKREKEQENWCLGMMAKSLSIELCIKGFGLHSADVVVVSPRNYFLFTPLLPSVTVGTLEARRFACHPNNEAS